MKHGLGYVFVLKPQCALYSIIFGLSFAVCFYTLVHSLMIILQQGVLDGKYDDLSEQSFYMVGGIEEVIAKAEKIAKENA